MSDVRNKRFFTLSAVAYSAIADIKGDESLFPEFLKWAIEGYREFNFATSYHLHVKEIDMKPWKQIDWPEDMVLWHKIGFRVGDTIKVFTNDESIPKVFDKKDCVPQENKPIDDLSMVSGEELVPFYGTDYFAPSADHYYGALLHYNYRGYFDVDPRLRVINFKRVVNNVNKVYLEYVSDGINYSGQTFIPPHTLKCLVNYIHWQRREHADDPGAERARRLYNNSFNDVLVMNLNLTLEDIKEALWAGYKQTPKS